MVRKTMVRKVFINKKTKQGSVTLSKKEIKKLNPDLKFGKHLFVRLEIFRKEKSGRK